MAFLHLPREIKIWKFTDPRKSGIPAFQVKLENTQCKV